MRLKIFVLATIFSFSDTDPLNSVMICCTAVANLYMASREELFTLEA